MTFTFVGAIIYGNPVQETMIKTGRLDRVSMRWDFQAVLPEGSIFGADLYTSGNMHNGTITQPSDLIFPYYALYS